MSYGSIGGLESQGLARTLNGACCAPCASNRALGELTDDQKAKAVASGFAIGVAVTTGIGYGIGRLIGGSKGGTIGLGLSTAYNMFLLTRIKSLALP